MTKFIYTYDVIRTDVSNRPVVYLGYPSKAEAETIAVAATNNVPGRTFKVVQRRKPNPDYVTVTPIA